MDQMIKGMPVTLIVKTQTGTDPFRRPVYTETEEIVENVLIGQPTTDEITNELNLSGKRIAYVLGIPKGDTHVWEDRDVSFFGKRFHSESFAREGIDALIPLSWNRKILVKRYG